MNFMGEVVSVVKRIGFIGKVFVIYGLKMKEIVGRDVEDVIKFVYEVSFFIIRKGVMMEEVERMIEKIKDEGIGWVIVVGGGSIIDVVKFFLFKMGVFFISFLIIVFYDGIVSVNVLIKDFGLKMFVKVVLLVVVIVDVKVIKMVFYCYLVVGVGDIISNLMVVRDW